MAALNLSLRCSQESICSTYSEKSLGSEGLGPIPVVHHLQEEYKKESFCDLCDYHTNRRSNLIRHLLTMHHTQVDQSMECCDIKFESKASLKEHKRDFHENGYTCKVCSREFCRRALLKRHMNVHSGKKDFQCHDCQYATSHKSNLDRHVSRLHSRGGNFVVQGQRQLKAVSRSMPCNPRKRSKMMMMPEDMSDQSSSSFSGFEDDKTSDDSNGSTVSSKPRLCYVSYKCLSCPASFSSQRDHASHVRLCYMNAGQENEQSVDESVLMAAIALTQLKHPLYAVQEEDGRGFLETI